ncbi:deoxyribodipyrimidine photo-lyase [Asticcacaulis sp. BYS171W]|uniref:Deoxyribodipyrimidine photo-lyase n=1 Tax=Asticcacaulis aquaticus TaxID=2984212 RepID=A0ABT5HNZ0_9CAUL|nr:deoxyribodipyrimidine photo-lyase [Asticcacaulis aquaticus]MDC7681781.1 deoxyribodipyrimidine photo-lyase [Asticcacaulis aquaticus]
MTDAVLLWFRSDLRLDDHAAVAEAVKSGLPVIPLYIFDDSFPARPLGAASKWWLNRSLAALDTALQRHGSRLILKAGDTEKILKEIIKENNIKTIFCSHTFEPKGEAFDARFAADSGIDVRRFNTHLLADPSAVRTGADGPYKVFTPFYRALLSKGYADGHTRRLSKSPWVAPETWSESLPLDALDLHPKLTPSGQDWSRGFDIWTPGEAGAHSRLQHFIAHGLKNYADGRDRPDLDLTSHLSPHLRFGEISPHRLLHDVERAVEHDASLRDGYEKFRSELAWRDFCFGILCQQPDLHHRNFKPQFDDMPWEDDTRAFRAWCRGETGYSLVDAGMRELWQTGIMHNRVRMVCASFLVKHLMIDWRKGEQWFWDTLLDADPANNPANWQWVAGSGADAAPYFRIFNPLTQAEKFDPKGHYRHRYITGFPEMKTSRSRSAHQKFEQDLFDFLGHKPDAEAGTGMIVDHGKARQRALDAYARLKNED